MNIEYKGQRYTLVSNDEKIEISTVDPDRLKPNEVDINESKNYECALQIKGKLSNNIKSISLDGIELDKIRESGLFGIKNNVGGNIRIELYEHYPCNVYDPTRKKITQFLSKKEGSEVGLTNIVPLGYEENDVDIIDGRTNRTLTDDEKKELMVDVYFEREFNTAIISFTMPSYPITVSHIYKKSNEKNITIDFDEIEDKVFSCAKHFSHIKSEESIYYLPEYDIRFDEEEKAKLVLLLK